MRQARKSVVSFGALLFLALVAPGCSLLDSSTEADVSERAPAERSEPQTESPTTTPSVPASPAPIEVTLERDVSRRQGGRVEDAQQSLVVEPFNGTALVAFASSDLRSDCVAEATLRVHTESVVGSKVEAWVSVETDLASLPDGASLGQYVIARGSPSVAGHPGTGTLTWDVTELLRWSRSNQDPDDSFVVVLKGDFKGYASSPIVIAASESGRPPVLEVAATPTCS